MLRPEDSVTVVAVALALCVFVLSCGNDGDIPGDSSGDAMEDTIDGDGDPLDLTADSIEDSTIPPGCDCAPVLGT